MRAEVGARAHGALDDRVGLRRGLEEHLTEERLGEPGIAEVFDRCARSGLGPFRIARRVAAAVDEHHPRDFVGDQPRSFENDAAAHAVADEHRARELEIVDERGDVAAVVLDRALVRPAGCPAMAAQVAGEHFMRALEVLELRAPVLVRAGKAVHENERG